MALGDMNYYVKQGNLESPLTLFLEDENGYIPPVQDRTIKFYIWTKGSPVNDVVNGREGRIVNAATGQVEMDWEENDTDTPGVFKVEVDLVKAGGRRETFPANGAMTLVIQARNEQEA